MKILRLSYSWNAIIALVSLFVSAGAEAGIVILNVNTALSSMSLGGQVGGNNGVPPTNGIIYTAQSPGSLVTSLAGTITADLTAGVFTFTPGSAISFNTTGTYTSAPNPIGSELGNYGIVATGPTPAAGGAVLTINGVYKNLVLDIGIVGTSGSTQNGSVLTGPLNFTNGALDFGISPAAAPPGTSSLIGSNGVNTSASVVTWNGTTLTIPVAFQTTGGTGRVENWSGTIVAAVPEPSSIALMSLVGVVGLSYATVRGRRAQRLVK